MKTPVIIAAHNEAELLGRTLRSLNHADVEPIVIANGCEDMTADVARSYGATTIELPEPGKLPAIQQGLKWLNGRALKTVLYTDADSYPLGPTHWVKAMNRSVSDTPQPAVSFGPIAHVDRHGPLDNLARSIKRQLDVRISKPRGVVHTIGVNMATRYGEQVILDEIVELPHVWPGEDQLMSEVVVAAGGLCRQVVDPLATVATSSRRMPPFFSVILQNHAVARAQTLESYRQRAAPNSITYGQYRRTHPASEPTD
jgi:glycosyltransferase involved in cell wall biosynthesis